MFDGLKEVKCPKKKQTDFKSFIKWNTLMK